MSINRVTLIGRWTKDLELKFTAGKGTAVATGVLAVDRRFKVEGQREADFIPIVIWGKQAESAATYTGKGKLCAVSGRIQTRNYEAKDGTRRYVTEVVADGVQFLQWGEGPQDNSNPINYDEEITPVNGDDIPF